MQLFPTRPAAHLAAASLAVAGVGVVLSQPAIVGWGASILVALGIARAVTLVSVARIRAAGFEMLWSQSRRFVRTTRGTDVEIEAEVRNRDTLAARYVKLRVLASPNLEVTLDPPAGEVVAGGRLKVKVTAKTPRVGQHGLYGLALEVRGAPGMFEVPLTFANPYGIEVAPRPMRAYLASGRGAASMLASPVGRPGKQRGDGNSLKELREHQPGDPFRHIAWRASARRGKLLVREHEREERDVVWVVLEATSDLWSGPLGRAPLDRMVDEAATTVSRHLAKGDRVGLALLDHDTRTLLSPDGGHLHGVKLMHALTTGLGSLDASRSDLDENDVAARVFEHLRPLDDRGLSDVGRNDFDRLAQRADGTRARAPFRVKAPEGRTERDAVLRRYLASFGIDVPPRSSPDRDAVAHCLLRFLTSLGRQRPRPSLVHVFAAPLEASHEEELITALGKLRRAGATIEWSIPSVLESLEPTPHAEEHDPEDEERAPPIAETSTPTEQTAPAARAVAVRSELARRRMEQTLARVGVRLTRPQAPRVVPSEIETRP